MGLSTVGMGTPFTSLTPPQIPWGLSPSSAVNVNPFGASHTYGLPFQQFGSQPLQQIAQLVQLVPQQVQQLLQLQYLQQHQLQQLQQILQIIPAQLAQLQQLMQGAPQHLQQMQQPFGPIAGAAGTPALNPWAVSSPLFGTQPGYVM